jgi:hypothetical protein
MTAAQQELFHLSILRVLDRNGTRFGLNPQAISILVNEFGFSPSLDETTKALEYMADKEIGFIAVVEKGHFHPHNAGWKITAKGINELRAHGH